MDHIIIRMIGCPAPYKEAITQRLAERGFGQDETCGSQDVVLVHCDSEKRWRRLESEVERHSVAIAVLPSPDLTDYVRALAVGAAGVVPTDTSSLITATVIEAAAHGEVVLPRQAAHSVGLLAQRLKPNTELTPDETDLIRALASGKTVVELAQQQYFSERTMRRHLQSLYLKLNARNRAEAITAAAKMGITN